MASGNLKDFGTVTVKSDKVEISTYVSWAKAHIVHLIAVLSTVVALLTSVNTAIDKYYPVVNNPPVVVVDDEENKLLSMDVNPVKAYKEAVENNVISNFPTGRNMASRFSDSAISAALIVPDKAIDVYKFVKIKTDKDASFYDLMVMTVYKGNIVFVDTVQTANKGEWVFTGPPGQYAVRLSSYNPTTGVSVDTGNVIIGEPAPTPTPTPTPVPTPTPTPTPTPVPTPTPAPVFTEKYGFSTFSFNEAMSKVDTESRKAYKNGLADNFEAVAASIAAGAFTDVKSSQIELAGRNRLTLNNNDAATVQKWTTFFSGWSARATELNKKGTLPNVLEEYRLVYLETSKGLRAVAQ